MLVRNMAVSSMDVRQARNQLDSVSLSIREASSQTPTMNTSCPSFSRVGPARGERELAPGLDLGSSRCLFERVGNGVQPPCV